MVDKDGNEVNHWNSERNSEMTVSKGMECGDIIAEKYPDIISQILTDMGNLADLTTEDKSSLVAAINEVRRTGGGGTAYTIGHGLKLDAKTNTLSVDMADKIEQDNTLPITAAAVYAEIGNINALLKTI